MDTHEVVVFDLVQSFSLDTERSNNQKRVVTMTLNTGKTLDPVALKVPRHADSTDVDGFIEKLTKSSRNPLVRATNLVNSLKALANMIQFMAQTTAQTSAVNEVQQRLNSGASSLQTARRAIALDTITDGASFEAGVAARKKGFSETAQEARVADNTMQQILGELRDTGVINEDEFRKEVRLSSLNAFNLRVLDHGFKAEWFI
ncbi:hypothetical protein INS49_011985 [Diaporthe citri]|uniref:uncharacterized protein n=1 Tax=Diaporthe citri TaxID=83186 RepID=UPI001C7FE112|nr:uncharacterized protein INS49_011985 [Diaporthe citri]KAG6360917.1 hypothetical protein INS49_011985 [Diaporthe citri]